MLNTDWTEVEVIELIVESATHLGFGMCGSKSTGVIVRCITPGGAAELDGRLRLGDHIVCIRDCNVRSYGPDQVATVLRQTISSCLSEGILTQDTPHISEISTTRMINTVLTTTTPASTNTMSPTLTNNTNMLSDKYSLSSNHVASSHVESDKTKPTNEHSLINPSVLLRLIVARPANGNPSELSEISFKQQAICRQHHVLGMLTIIPTHQLDQYIELLLHKNLPFVDLYSYCKTNSLDNENSYDTLKIKSNHNDYFELRKPVNCIESEFLKISDVTESFVMSSKQLEQFDADDIREIEPYSTLEISISSQNSSQTDVDQADTNLPSRIIADDFIDNTFKCNRRLNYQHFKSSCSIPSSFNEFVTGNISQKDSSIRVKNDKNKDNDETEIHIVHLTKPKDQGLGLIIVGYIYNSLYDENTYNNGIFVQNVIPNSISDNCQSIQVNDQIIQVNEISLIGLDNVQAVSILKKSDADITLKLKRYLHGFLYEELQKSGHLKMNNNPIQNHLKKDNTSLLDQTSDHPYPISNSAFINRETSDSSDRTTNGKLHQHEYYPLNNNNFNHSNILYVELTEDFMDPSCSSLSDQEGILKSMVLENEEGRETLQLSNNDNIHRLSSEFFSDRFIINANCRTFKYSDANLGDNTESFKQEVTGPIIMSTLTTMAANKHDFLNMTMDFEVDGFIGIINSTDDNSNSRNNSCEPAFFSNEFTTKLEACSSTCKKIFNTSDPISFGNDTVASKQINGSNSFKSVDHINTLFNQKVEIANEVTQELVDLMHRVWLPIVGPGYDIIVLRFHKSRGISNLGISVQGMTYVAEPDFCYTNQSSTSDSLIGDKYAANSQFSADGLGKSTDSYDNGYNDKPSRHFIQYIVPDGLIGSLGVVQKGDELLQANGHRIRGTSHTSTLRYLRNLPSRVELVFARRKSTHENGNNKMLNITSENDQSIDGGIGEPPLEVVSSDVGSVDTTSSTRIVNTYGDVNRSLYSSPVSPTTAHKRVTEWIRKSQGDLSAASPESSIIEKTHTESKTVNPYSFEYSNSYTFGPRHDCVNSDYTINSKQYLVNTLKDKRKYSLSNTQIEMGSNTFGRVSSSRSSGEFIQQQSSVEHYDLRRYQTLPHYLYHNRPKRIDPRYGFKRPRWSSVPLIIQLNKTSHGFGFSIAEYEELPVTDLESKSYRKALTFDRKTSNMIESDRLSFRSYYSTASTTTSLDNNPKTSNALKRRSTWSSRSKTRGILLIDSLTPGGVAQLDGRISIGDRLLFVNDKNLIKASIRKAAHTLKSLPNGPCLIGIAKMQLESNETYRTQEQQQQRLLSYPPVPTRPSVIGMFPDPDERKTISNHYNLAYPLHVNTCDSINNNDDNNTIVSRHDINARLLCFKRFNDTTARSTYSCPCLHKPPSDSLFSVHTSISYSGSNYSKYLLLSTINKQLLTGNDSEHMQHYRESFHLGSSILDHTNTPFWETSFSYIHRRCKSCTYIEQFNEQIDDQRRCHRHHHCDYMCKISDCAENCMIHGICKCLNDDINHFAHRLVHEIVLKAVNLINYKLLKDSVTSNSITDEDCFVLSTSSLIRVGATASVPTCSRIQFMSSEFEPTSYSSNNNNRLRSNLSDCHSTSLSSSVSNSSCCNANNSIISLQYLSYQLVCISILKALNYLRNKKNNDRLFGSSVAPIIQHSTLIPRKSTTIELASNSRELSVSNEHYLPHPTQNVAVNHGLESCSAFSKTNGYYIFQFISNDLDVRNSDVDHDDQDVYLNTKPEDDDSIITKNDNTADNDEEEDVKTECDLSTNSTISLSSYIRSNAMSSSIECDHHEFRHSHIESIIVHSFHSLPKLIIKDNTNKSIHKHYNSAHCCVDEDDCNASHSCSSSQRFNVFSTFPYYHQYRRHRHDSRSGGDHVFLDKQLPNISNIHENFHTKNDLCATTFEDLALDFYALPLLCPNPQLHAPELQYATPVDPKLEITRRLERGSLPIGLKLDALACHGQDGCRVLQVLGGGAVARDQFIVTNDYVTSLNGISMRYLDNLKAFKILHSLSQNSAIIDITFFPASIIESHRIKCLSKVMSQPSEDPFQKNSIPYLSIVQPLNWSPAIEIVLYRIDASQQWGLVVSGPDICSIFNCLAPLNLENPSILSEILPNSVGSNCKLLSCGLLILKIQGNDVSTKGANYVNAYLQHLSNQSDLCELHLVVCHFNDSNDDDFANNTTKCGIGQSVCPINQLPLDSQDINNNNNNNSWDNDFDLTGKIELSNDSNILPSINAQLECDHFMPPRTSPSSSDMENPEPLTDMESHDIVDILCRSDPSSDPNNFGSQPNPYRKNNQCLLSQLSSPVLKDEDNTTVDTEVTFPGVKSDTKMKLQNGWFRGGDDCSFNSPPPPRSLPRRLSVSLKYQDTEKLQHMLVVDSNANQLNSSDLVKFYTRYSQDEIHVIRLPLLHNSPSNYCPNVNEVMRNFDLDLVSCCNPEVLATFVAKCQNNFISLDSDDYLQWGDEIVQVEDISVCGLNHLSVQQIIHSKVVEILSNKVDNNSRTTYYHSIGSSDGGRIDGSSQSFVKPFISLIIRRNPINRSLISSSHFSGSSLNVVSETSEVYSLLNETLTNKNSSDAFSSPSPSFLPTGSKPIPHSFLKQIMVELNEDFRKFQLFDIVLERGSDGFGIFIVNMGRNNEPGVFVTEIRENSPASLQAVLRPHDRILAIDGQLQCDYESTLELLQQSRKSVRLTIGRQISYLSDPLSSGRIITTGNNTDVDDKHHKLPIIPGIPSSVTLYKTDGGLGFSIVGGSDTILGNILIHEVHSGGAAARDGRLQVGDRLLAVNGIDLRDATQKGATKIIRTANDCIQLIVYRDPEPQYLNHDMFECHNVHLKRDMPGCSFGLSLIDRPHYSTGTAIGAITENSPAARSNLLEVGDVILEINGWDMRLAKSEEVITLLKNVHSDVKLLIGRYKTAPSSHAYPRNRLHVYVVVLERRQLAFSNDLSHVKKCYSTHLLPTSAHDDVNKHTQSEQEQHNSNLLVDLVCQKTDKSEVHDLYSLSNHSSTVNDDHKSDVGNDDEIALAAFGLRIRQANSQELWDSHSRLIVDSVQHNSPADRSGMIMPGDRLLSVDREPVDWLNPNEVVQLLANLPYCTIELGRLPYFNTSQSTDNNPISNKCIRHHSPSAVSLPTSHRVQQDEHDIFPPYPPPSQELPALFGGIMPNIEPPSFLRDMCTLPEQQDEYDESKTGFEHGENDDNDCYHYRLSERSYLTIYPNNQQDQIDSISNMTPLNKEEIEKALELAGRSSGGFFVRQIYLPIAPINNINNTVKSNHQLDIHLGLRLTNGPGISGPVVVRITPNSCASRTDIQIGDRILGLDDKLLLSLSQDNNSADDILCTIESVWITRSMNSQPIYEQNPCCLTIVSNHSLPLFTSIGQRKIDPMMEKGENLIKCPENNTQLAVCLGDLHLTNDNYGSHNRIDSIEKENLENHLVPSTIITPSSFGSKPSETTGENDYIQYNEPKMDHPYLDDGSYQDSISSYNHHYELPVHLYSDILRHSPNKSLFADSVSKMKMDPKDATAVVFNTTSVQKQANGNKQPYSSSSVESKRNR